MLERLNRCWRILATGFCFAVFGLGGLVVRCVVYPVLLLTVRNPLRRQHLSQAVIHHSFRWFVALMRGVGVLAYEVRGLERLQRRGLLHHQLFGKQHQHRQLLHGRSAPWQ